MPVHRRSTATRASTCRTLTRQTGLTALDYGFVNTASTRSAITYIDGEQGILRYRGYPSKSSPSTRRSSRSPGCSSTASCPTADQLGEFDEKIRRHTLLHEDLKRFFSALPHTAHPMSVLSSAVSALSTYYEDSSDPHDPEHVELTTVRLLAKLPVIAAYAHKKSDRPGVPVPRQLARLRAELPAAELRQHGRAATSSRPRARHARSTGCSSCTRTTSRTHRRRPCASSGSTGANLYASISAGIQALSGPLHGGANEAVLQMLARIRDSGEGVGKFVERVKNKEDGVKLMGFGHRVYKNYDPRAKIVKQSADEVLAGLGVADPLLDIAKELEQFALQDDYFKERRLYPNVDFYTGVIYKAMGFPTRMFTVLFAIGRLPGWMAHWREMNLDPQTKIGRPQQLYIGEPERHYPGGLSRAGLVTPVPPGGGDSHPVRRPGAGQPPAGRQLEGVRFAASHRLRVNGQSRSSPRCQSGAWSA